MIRDRDIRPSGTGRVILHSDINSCYASIEELYHPQLRGRPIAVGGDGEHRHGIILAKNQKAKKAGVVTGMALWQARDACRDLCILPARMDLYLKFSSLANEIYSGYTDLHQSFGVDEQWLDVTDIVGPGKRYCSGTEIAEEIRSRFKKELGITVSVGVSWNKIFAKLGSDYKKPDAVTVIDVQNYRNVVFPLPVQDLLMVGTHTQRKLNSYGIMTIGDLAEADSSLLEYILGKNGVMLKMFACGMDTSPVTDEGYSSPVKSIGNSCTAPRDLETDDEVKTMLYMIAESVSARLRENGFVCGLIEISIRDKDLFTFTRQRVLGPRSSSGAARPDSAAVTRRKMTGLKSRIDEYDLGSIYSTDITSEIFEFAYQLYLDNYVLDGSAYSRKPIRSIGIRAGKLRSKLDPEQLCLFETEQGRDRKRMLDECTDTIRRRYGFESIQTGLVYTGSEIIDAGGEHVVHPTGYMA